MNTLPLIIGSNGSKVTAKVKVFRYLGQRSRSRSIVKKCWYETNDRPATGNVPVCEIYKKYGKPIWKKIGIFHIFEIHFQIFEIHFQIFEIHFQIFKIHFQIFEIHFQIFEIHFQIFEIHFQIFKEINNFVFY